MKPDPMPHAKAAIRFLKRTDPVMERLIDEVGPFRMAHRPARFQALVRAIIFQQLAGKAALAIYRRFVVIVGGGRFPTPLKVLAASDEDMRRAGLSRAKASYIRDLAAHVRDRSLSFGRFRRLDDEEIIRELTRVKGIGRWTAEMFLMFNLCRPDVLPVDDLGFRNAVMKRYGMQKPPTAKELRAFGERWRPYRSVAVWYLWQSTRIVTLDASGAQAGAGETSRKRKKSRAGRRMIRAANTIAQTASQ